MLSDRSLSIDVSGRELKTFQDGLITPTDSPRLFDFNLHTGDKKKVCLFALAGRRNKID
jgi:hypothetical protein